MEYNKLKRNYKENPLKKGEYPEENDIKYLFLDCCLSRKECAEICYCTEEKVKIACRKYEIKKTKEQRNALRKRTTLQKYGAENVSQLVEVKQKKIQTTLEHYGTENPAQAQEVKEKAKKTCLERYGVESTNSLQEKKEKIKQTFLKRYNVENAMHVPSIKQKQQQTNLTKYGNINPIKNPEVRTKREKTCLEKYGKENLYGTEYFKSKSKETCLEKYGTDNIMKTIEMREHFKQIKPQIIAKLREKQEESLKKALKTKRINQSFSKSQPENNIYTDLSALFPSTERQYRSELYPFACDFYIPELDLYIEFQGSWTHGGMPFEQNNTCLAKLAKWQEKAKDSDFYKNAIYTWTDLDVRKRNTAKENNLNWIEFFNYEEFTEWYNELCMILTD